MTSSSLAYVLVTVPSLVLNKVQSPLKNCLAATTTPDDNKNTGGGGGVAATRLTDTKKDLPPPSTAALSTESKKIGHKLANGYTSNKYYYYYYEEDEQQQQQESKDESCYSCCYSISSDTSSSTISSKYCYYFCNDETKVSTIVCLPPNNDDQGRGSETIKPRRKTNSRQSRRADELYERGKEKKRSELKRFLDEKKITQDSTFLRSSSSISSCILHPPTPTSTPTPVEQRRTMTEHHAGRGFKGHAKVMSASLKRKNQEIKLKRRNEIARRSRSRSTRRTLPNDSQDEAKPSFVGLATSRRRRGMSYSRSKSNNGLSRMSRHQDTDFVQTRSR